LYQAILKAKGVKGYETVRTSKRGNENWEKMNTEEWKTAN